MQNPVVSREEWLTASKALLAREKEATRLRDAVNAERLALPWVEVTEDYRFDTPDGEKSLSDLFDGRSQLVVYHFMLGTGWEAGCPGCSFLADHFDGTLAHLNHHDVTLVAVSRGTLPEIETYKRRMGWHFPWVSSARNRFNFDYHVSFTPEDLSGKTLNYNFTEIDVANGNDELPGLSAFYKDEAGKIYHTYSSYARGGEELIGTYMILDRAPKGRNEQEIMDWMRRHDEYQDAPEQQEAQACCA